MIASLHKKFLSTFSAKKESKTNASTSSLSVKRWTVSDSLSTVEHLCRSRWKNWRRDMMWITWLSEKCFFFIPIRVANIPQFIGTFVSQSGPKQVDFWGLRYQPVYQRPVHAVVRGSGDHRLVRVATLESGWSAVPSQPGADGRVHRLHTLAHGTHRYSSLRGRRTRQRLPPHFQARLSTSSQRSHPSTTETHFEFGSCSLPQKMVSALLFRAVLFCCTFVVSDWPLSRISFNSCGWASIKLEESLAHYFWVWKLCLKIRVLCACTALFLCHCPLLGL